MARLSVNVSGLDEVIGRLDPANIERALKKAYREIGRRALKVWRTSTPRRTGVLRKSLFVRQIPEGLSFRVRARGFYYAPANHRLGGRMTHALRKSLTDPAVDRIFERHLREELEGK